MYGFEELIATPDITFLLITFGVYGIIFEATNPGMILPGSFGAISFLLGLSGFMILPINYTGLVFMSMGILFMGAEAVIPSLGILAISGIISFAIGGSELIDKEVYGSGVSWWVIGFTTTLTLAVVLFIIKTYINSRKKKPSTGIEALINSNGEIINWSKNNGEVLVAGTIWQATSSLDYILKKGDNITVLAINKLCIIIAPKEDEENNMEKK